jgi:transcriptional regulator with XRE-family HTH domain
MSDRNLIYREFGLLLAGERKRKRLSQAQFAELAGLSRTSVTNIECGRQAVQLHQLLSFASILRIEVQLLLPKETPTVPTATQSRNEGQARYLEQTRRLLPDSGKS